ncbi:MAG: nicotinamide mononucleotide transporter [Ruminococcaceae bacterium]|nr:nicotinamide mononucleotide transporter [Oscillospiraceae bacterium]
MKFKNSFCDLTKFELGLWLTSVLVVILSFLLSGGNDILTITASLIGVTALIFVAKGYVLGQILTVIFALFYGIISFYFRYYGEMMTYLCMTAPIAVSSVISWMKNPYKDTKEVAVRKLKKSDIVSVFALALMVTAIFYFILAYLNNENLLFSTISVTTSFIACYLTFLRSPYYALGYAANDIVLIILWILASVEDISYIPMVFCFIMFLVNDLYGFFNWLRMEKRQIRNL